MAKRIFRVKILWDAEAQVYYSESNIEGLYIEGATLEEFEAVLLDVAPDLIATNYFSASTNPAQPTRTMEEFVRDLIPTIVLDWGGVEQVTV